MVQIIIFNVFFSAHIFTCHGMKSTADTHGINDDLSYLSVAVKPCIMHHEQTCRGMFDKKYAFCFFFQLKLFSLKHRL